LIYHDPTGHWPEWLDKKIEVGKQWVNDKVVQPVVNTASDVWDTTKSTVSSGYNYVNNKVIKPAVNWTNDNLVQPVVQTVIKTKETVEYVIENPPSSPKEVLAMGAGFTVTAIKNNIYDPLFVDLPTVVGAFTGVPNIMEYRYEMQKRGTLIENRFTNFFGIQDNEYYYIGGTLASSFDMGKSVVEVVGGGIVFTLGSGVTGASLGGAAPTMGASLVGTLVGVPAMALGVAVGGHGVSSAISGYNSFNQNYNKFDEMTGGGGTSKKISKRNEYLGRTPGKNSKTGKEVIKKMEQEGNIKTVHGQKQFKASDGKWYPIEEADMSHITDAVAWWNETGRNYGAKSKEVRKWMLDSDNYYLDHYSINRSQGAKLSENYLPPTQ